MRLTLRRKRNGEWKEGRAVIPYCSPADRQKGRLTLKSGGGVLPRRRRKGLAISSPSLRGKGGKKGHLLHKKLMPQPIAGEGKANGDFHIPRQSSREGSE